MNLKSLTKALNGLIFLYILSMTMTLLNIVCVFQHINLPFAMQLVVLTPISILVEKSLWMLVILVLFFLVNILSIINLKKRKKSNMVHYISSCIYLIDIIYMVYIYIRENFIYNMNDHRYIFLMNITTDLIMIVIIIIVVVFKKRYLKKLKLDKGTYIS